MTQTAKQTPLYEWHRANGANMADFGGYDMPLWYSSAKNEHLAVLKHAGIFDTSHMAVIRVSGADGFALLQTAFTQDLLACVGRKNKPLTPGRCVYGAYLNADGHVIDDSIINQIAGNEYMLVVNAGMGGPVAEHLKASARDRDAQIRDLTDQVGKMDVQGPRAGKIMANVLENPEAAFHKLPYFSFKGHFDPASPLSRTVKLLDGTPILLSRTGYTGEFGFEIFTTADRIVSTWEIIYNAGAEFGATPCGLAARDSLRAGAVLPLSHQDIGHWPFVNHPWPFALPYNAGKTEFSKAFIGSDALASISSPEYTLPFAGFDLRKVSLPATVHDAHMNEVGIVLTCVTDMGIGRMKKERIYSIADHDKPENLKIRGLSCGFVKVSRKFNPGDTIVLKDDRRKLTAEIVNDIRPNRTARYSMKRMMSSSP